MGTLRSEDGAGGETSLKKVNLCSLSLHRDYSKSLIFSCSYSFELFKFHDFPWLFSMTFSTFPWPSSVKLRLSKSFKTILVHGSFWHTHFNKQRIWPKAKCAAFPLFSYSSLSQFFLLWQLHRLIYQTVKHRFNSPWLPMTDTFQAWKMKFISLWLSRFSMTCTSLVYHLLKMWNDRFAHAKVVVNNQDL